MFTAKDIELHNFTGKPELIAAILNADEKIRPILLELSVARSTVNWSYIYEPEKLSELKLLLLNQVISGHGVETIYTASGVNAMADYINFGETYQVTILYDYTINQFMLTSWGDWLENYERQKADLLSQLK